MESSNQNNNQSINYMTKKQAVELYAILRELKNGSMSKEGLTSFILMRLKLKTIFDEFEKTRIEISSQTKPEDFKEGDNTEKWDSLFQATMAKWLSENADIDTEVLSQTEYIDLIHSNDLNGWMQDTLFENLVIK